MASKTKKTKARPSGKAKAKAAPKSRSAGARKQAARPPAPRQPAAPKWKPPHMQDLVANLVLSDAAAGMDFYKRAFGATEVMRMMAPDGRSVWHGELRIGDSILFLNDNMPGSPLTPPSAQHKPTASFQIYVPDCDAVFNRAVQAGAKPGMPLADMFWGDRMGSVADPFGQVWMISTRVRVLTEDQMRKAGEEFAAEMARQHQNLGGQPPAPNAS